MQLQPLSAIRLPYLPLGPDNGSRCYLTPKAFLTRSSSTCLQASPCPAHKQTLNDKGKHWWHVPRQAPGGDFPEFVMRGNLFCPPAREEPGTRWKSHESGPENVSFNTHSARGCLIIPVTSNEKVTHSIINN